MSDIFLQTIDGPFWNAIASYHSILIVKDLVGTQNWILINNLFKIFSLGLQRAIGGLYFMKGSFESGNYANFSSMLFMFKKM